VEKDCQWTDRSTVGDKDSYVNVVERTSARVENPEISFAPFPMVAVSVLQKLCMRWNWSELCPCTIRASQRTLH
jgi:hypothetical protein